VLGKHDDAGRLLEIGIGFRGTSGPRESLISDFIGDLVSDLLAALGPKDYAKNYAGEAFGGLLKTLADYAGAHGLSGSDVVVSGHSLSDPARATTWVQDLNRNAEPHKGNTFIIGSDGNDLIQGGKGADFIEGGKGNDTLRDNSGHNTFLFSGQFGQDRVIGYQSTDKLVFTDVQGSLDYREYAKAVGGDTVISFGTNSVTLVGVSNWSGEGVVIS